MSARPILVMAGGTGGHVYPALAVAQALQAQSREIVWLGTRRGIEARIVPAAGIEVEWISVKGLRRKGLLALAGDLRDLRKKPPGGARDWPVRLLPLWESMLMGHADKSWTVPKEAERKRVWRKAAFVASVALARGRVVALWTQAKRAKRLDVSIEPLGGWRKSRHLAQVRREAQAVARHLGVEEASVTVES